jgi:AcrR family transcriptional regulator
MSTFPSIQAQPTPKITKADRTRAVILDSALGFLWSQPFHELTVTKLMQPTGAVRSTFYRYFKDLQEVMEVLLDSLKDEIFIAVEPWLTGRGDPVALVNQTLGGLVDTCYNRGPFLRAFTDAASSDARFEKAWKNFMESFDEAATARIEADQQQGLIPEFDAYPVAFALNRLDAATLIDAFGRRPRKQREPIRIALTRIWVSTLYGDKWQGRPSSSLLRNF